MFPFEVPADLSALSVEDLAAFGTKVREHIATLLADQNTSAGDLRATRDLYATVTAEEDRRKVEAEQAAADRAELAGMIAAPAPVAPAAIEPTEILPPAVPAAPAVVASTIDPAPPADAPRYAVLLASSDTRGAGGTLADFDAVGDILEARLATYSSSTESDPNARKREVEISGTGRAFRIDGRRLTRHSNALIKRQFPEDLRIPENNPKGALKMLLHGVNERRLPGGSLIASTQKIVEAGRALTAAVGWCAPSEVIYDLCALESLDGMLSLPTMQSARGGFQIPENGGPDFSAIFGALGEQILTEYDVENGTEKVCIEVPCPDFVNIRMDVAYICLTGSFLQDRGYPEIVTRFSQGSIVALAHKINADIIARIEDASSGLTTIPTIANSDDAVSQLLSAIEVAIEDIKYRNRMQRAGTIEIVLPAWVIAPMRAALARRRGVASWNVSDAEILDAFTTRRAVPHFVYDWQDSYSDTPTGPGAASPITAFPTSVRFLAYPAGTWSKIERDVINLDTVYDSAMITQNQYTALFTEDGFNVLQLCADSRVYQVDISPAGIVGCCA
jgi:hypothetical protein